MTKTTKKDFELFKKECKKFIDLFELNNWSIVFEHSNKKGMLASCVTDISSYRTVISFCKKWDDSIEKMTKSSIVKLALHEVLHLLLARMSDYGNSRFLNRDELIEAEEELVNKLINIL